MSFRLDIKVEMISYTRFQKYFLRGIWNQLTHLFLSLLYYTDLNGRIQDKPFQCLDYLGF